MLRDVLRPRVEWEPLTSRLAWLALEAPDSDRPSSALNIIDRRHVAKSLAGYERSSAGKNDTESLPISWSRRLSHKLQRFEHQCFKPVAIEQAEADAIEQGPFLRLWTQLCAYTEIWPAVEGLGDAYAQQLWKLPMFFNGNSLSAYPLQVALHAQLGLGLSRATLAHLAGALLGALQDTSEVHLRTYFISVWHPSFITLSDKQLSLAKRLAEYLLLPQRAFTAIGHAACQRVPLHRVLNVLSMAKIAMEPSRWLIRQTTFVNQAPAFGRCHDTPQASVARTPHTHCPADKRRNVALLVQLAGWYLPSLAAELQLWQLHDCDYTRNMRLQLELSLRGRLCMQPCGTCRNAHCLCGRYFGQSSTHTC
jgi:hypothetical protein